MIKNCLNCGNPLPERKRWRVWVDELLMQGGPPVHDPNGPDGEACWAGLNARMGILHPGPKPTRTTPGASGW